MAYMYAAKLVDIQAHPIQPTIMLLDATDSHLNMGPGTQLW